MARLESQVWTWTRMSCVAKRLDYVFKIYETL